MKFERLKSNFDGCMSNSESDDRGRRPRKTEKDFWLAPRLRILVHIFFKGKVKNNISELSRTLGYAKDSWINTLINELKEKGFIKESADRRFLRVTKSGRKLISPFTRGRSFSLLTAFMAFIVLYWAISAILFHFQIANEALLATGALLVFLTIEIRRSQRQIEELLS